MKVIFRKKLILKHSKRKIIYIGGKKWTIYITTVISNNEFDNIYNSIKYHNKLYLPKDLNKEASLISKILNINAF